MSFLHSFETGRHHLVKGHFENLVNIALADGKIDDAEYEFLLSLAERFYTTEEELKKIIEKQRHFPYHPPTNKEDRLDHLKDVVSMLMIDGKILKEEIEMCRKLAIALHYPPNVVVKIVNVLIKYSSTDFDKYDVLSEIEDIVDA